MTHLTIAYITFRKQPHIEWFIESLTRETNGALDGMRVVVVDYFHDLSGRAEYQSDLFEKKFKINGQQVVLTLPKPCVYQGKHRLTKKDYFAAANARNTALCLAPDGYLACVDDLSILMPGWLSRVRAAMVGNYIACGAYKKVMHLGLVDDPDRATYAPFDRGIDSRWKHGHPSHSVSGYGSWFFGCSLAVPTAAMIAVNGWEEACNSLGFEDSITGILLERRGYKLMYDRSMLTLEDEEGHYKDDPLPRFDKGVSPADKSHAVLDRTMKGDGKSTCYLPGGIAGERERVLRGEPWTIPTQPTHDWFDNQPLNEL